MPPIEHPFLTVCEEFRLALVARRVEGLVAIPLIEKS